MQRFIETVSIDSRLFKKVNDPALREKLNKLSLSAEGDTKQLAESLVKESNGITAWEVPISKYNVENANGRVYPKELWERVLNEQRQVWEGAPMLADHPSGDSDGDPGRICGIWLEARMAPDGYVYGTFVPSGSLGRDMQEHLKNGLRAGTSSSGFGELMKDGKTVDPATYMIERLSDWVLTPSQGTYFTYEANTRETKNASDSRLGESANKSLHVVNKEETIMPTSITKLEEKKFRKDMESFLEDAQRLGDPQTRLKEFEEILSFLEEGATPDLREKVVAKIAEEKAAIESAIKETSILKTELGIESVAHLKEKLTRIVEDAAVLDHEATDWKKIATALQTKLDETRNDLQARPTSAYVTHLRSKIKKLYAEKKTFEASITAQKSKIAEAAAKKDSLLEAIDTELSEYKLEVAKREKTIVALGEQVTRLQSRAAQLEEQLATEKEEFKEFKAQVNAKPKLSESPADSISRYMNFREGDAVDAYWADLAMRHGADIRPYETRIRAAKTVREAMATYMRILPMLNESVEYEAARLPESVAVNMKERGIMLEKAGARLTADDTIDRLPKTWV